VELRAYTFIDKKISALLKNTLLNTCWIFSKKGKSPFLTIQLLPQFGFGHRASKPDIFDHPTLKTVHN
jgi:hypothetical protein